MATAIVEYVCPDAAVVRHAKFASGNQIDGYMLIKQTDIVGFTGALQQRSVHCATGCISRMDDTAM